MNISSFKLFQQQAYVGVAKDLNAIIIAFRGTQEHRYGSCYCNLEGTPFFKKNFG